MSKESDHSQRAQPVDVNGQGKSGHDGSTSARCTLTHRGPVDLRKWAIFNTILMSPKSWLSQEDLDAGCEHSLVPVDSEGS